MQIGRSWLSCSCEVPLRMTMADSSVFVKDQELTAIKRYAVYTRVLSQNLPSVRRSELAR